MGGPVVFGVALLLIFLLSSAVSTGGQATPGQDGPFPPEPGPGPGPLPPGPHDGPAIIPGTLTPVSEVEPRDANDFEMKRQLVSKAFTSALQRRVALLPKEPKATGVNATAAFFRKNGVFIDRPDPRQPPTYYKQPREKMTAHLAEISNVYERGIQNTVKPASPKKQPPTPNRVPPKPKPVPNAKKPGPSVTTTPDEKKIAVVRKGYSDALVYLIDSLKQRKGVTVAPTQAIVPVSQYFSMFGIPAPDSLTAASSFWARSLSDITSNINQAVRYTRQQVDIQTGVTVPPTV